MNDGHPVISLTPKEIMQAALVGVMRQVENLAKGRRDAHGTGDDWFWNSHIEGALGEFAFAKHLGVFWSGAHAFRGADVVDREGNRWEVRTSTRHDYKLRVHETDPDEARVVLLTGRHGRYVIRGWISAKDAKQQRWVENPWNRRPAFFVPQGELCPVEVA